MWLLIFGLDILLESKVKILMFCVILLVLSDYFGNTETYLSAAIFCRWTNKSIRNPSSYLSENGGQKNLNYIEIISVPKEGDR